MDSEDLCPECKAGKHHNCDGTIWNFDTDEYDFCKCKECLKDYTSE